MQAFDMQGMWWLPEDPGNRCFGTLACNEKGESSLAIIGVFPGVDFHQSERVILGDVVDRRNGRQRGRHVTLRGCILTNASHSSAPIGNSQEFLASRVFLGEHLVAPSDFSFSRARVSFSGLNMWAHDLSGFEDKVSPETQVSWKHPEPISGSIDGAQFALGADCTALNTMRQRRLTESVRLNLTFSEPIREEDLQANYLYPLQNFFSFATDHPNALAELSVSRRPMSAEDITVIGPRTFADEAEAANVLPFEMLFTLEDVSGRVAEVVRRWFQLSKQHSEAFALYFGGMYRPPGYTDLRLTMIMQVLSLYRAGGWQLPEGFVDIGALTYRAVEAIPDGVRRGITDLLDTHPLVMAARTLTALMVENGKEFEPLLNMGGDGGRSGFVTYALNSLKYLITRRTPFAHYVIDETMREGPAPYASDGAAQYWLTQRLALLLKMSLLRGLGFSPEQIQTIMDRNRLYQHIRDKAP